MMILLEMRKYKMINEEKLKLIEIEIQKNPNNIFKLTDAELISYKTYLTKKIKEKKEIIDNKKESCKNLLNILKHN